MSSNITLSAGVRSNLLNLQSTAALKDLTQSRLSTGKKVNSALDNPSNFFTAASLSSRSSDLSSLLDGISNGIQTLKAADNGIKSITSSIESLQATVRQARQDKSFKNASFEIDATAIAAGSTPQLKISGGAVGTTSVDIDLQNAAVTAVSATPATLTGAGGSDLSGDADLSALVGETITLTAGSNTVSYTFTNAVSGQMADLETALSASGFTTTGTADGLNISRADGANVTLTTSDAAVDTEIGLTGGDVSTDGVAAIAAVPASSKSVDQIVDLINNNSGLTNKVRASNDSGKLRIENLSTVEGNIDGFNATSQKFDGTGTSKKVGGTKFARTS